MIIGSSFSLETRTRSSFLRWKIAENLSSQVGRKNRLSVLFIKFIRSDKGLRIQYLLPGRINH